MLTTVGGRVLFVLNVALSPWCRRKVARNPLIEGVNFAVT
jgi:hypothetical protein